MEGIFYFNLTNFAAILHASVFIQLLSLKLYQARYKAFIRSVNRVAITLLT